jgi:hypothetical protein
MNDKYLGKEGIEEKYNFRGDCICGMQTLGMAIGYGYTLFNIFKDVITQNDMHNNDLIKVMGGFAIGTASYFIGYKLHKRNENKKDKIIRDIENKAIA